MRKPRRRSDVDLTPLEWPMPRLPRKDRGSRLKTMSCASVEEVLHLEPALAGDGIPSAEINWQRLFGNDHPVEIEVGMGKGLFLLNSALARTETNFFGIEVVKKFQVYATTRFFLRRISNVRTVCADARWVLSRFVPPTSVAAIHVYFPDPWWKTRHKKRRLFTHSFAISAARAIVPGGRLLIASDVEEYFGVMRTILRGLPAFKEQHTETSTESLATAGYQTNFERKARAKGTPIWRATFERTTGSIP